MRKSLTTKNPEWIKARKKFDSGLDLTTEETAVVLGLALETVRRARIDGKITARREDGMYVFEADEVRRYLEEK